MKKLSGLRAPRLRRSSVPDSVKKIRRRGSCSSTKHESASLSASLYSAGAAEAAVLREKAIEV